MNEILTINQAAEKLHVHHNTVRRWIAEGKLKASRPSKKYLITMDAIMEFLKQTELK